MSTQVPCLVFLFLIIVLVLVFGGYYTYQYQKKTHLASCYHLGGRCLEVENCDSAHQNRRNVTTCIHKRKVCCMPEPQPRHNIEDYEDFP
ncbi:hypothetical protein KR054_001977 [Drosophila jambulina]|nr:hypothetical protein KR054_001977 [Drosophila jambulina]